jgi:tetratricopeptide (TPR) repeat protein
MDQMRAAGPQVTGSFRMEKREMARLSYPRQIALGFTVAAGMLVVSSHVAEAQSSRMRVLVPAFEVKGDPRSRTGERMANEVKKHINAMVTHAPVDDRAARDALRKFNLRQEDMNCVQWRQLATHVNADLVLCGTVDEATNQVEAGFWNLAGDAFEVPPFSMQNPDHGAQQVVQAFGTYVRQLSLLVNCNDYLLSQSWQQALDQCNQAVELNPLSVTGHYARGSALARLDRPEEALAAFARVLEIDELNQDALLHAGILAATLGRSDESQQYFARYLELNPGNEQVRLTIATDLANAGDPAGALRLMEDLIQAGQPSGQALEYAGHFAFTAGERLRGQAGPAADAGNEAVKRFYETAVRYYGQATAVRGDSLDPTVYRNTMMAYHQLGNREQALLFGQRAIAATPDDANAWLVWAEVLSGSRRMDDALRAFDRAQELNPELANINARKAVMLLEAGRIQEAVAAVRTGLQRGDVQPETAEQIAQQLAFRGYNHTQQNRHEQALQHYAAAREIAKAQRSIGMINFFQGFTLIKQGDPLVRDANTAAAGRRALPLFQQAKTLLEGAAAYSEQAAVRAQLLQQVQQFIELAEALIKSGR